MKYRLLFIVLFITSSVFSQSDIYYFKDSSSSLTYETILEKEFKLLKKQILDKHSNDVYWFKVPAYKTDSKYVIRIPYDRIYKADAYQNLENVEMLSNERYVSYRFSRDYDFYIKVTPELHSYIPIELDTQAESISKDKNELILSGFYYGFAFLIIIYNLSYYFLFKDEVFLYYSLFLFSMSLGVFIMDGMLNFFHVPKSIGDFLMTLNYIFLAYFSSKFANCYLLLDSYYPKFKKISYSIGIAIVILAVLYLNFKNYYHLLLLNILLFGLLFSYWLFAIILFKKNIYTKILAFAYVIILFSGIDFFILKFLGASIVDIDATNIKVGGFLEMIILSIAVLYRMKILREENVYMRDEIIKFSTKFEEQTLSKSKIEFLSSREREIFNLIVSIKTNKEIANQLNVSVNTVKFHIKNIYEKLEIKSRKEALTIAENAIK